MATHSSILAWEISWTKKPGGLQSMGLQRVRHDSATKQHKIENVNYINTSQITLTMCLVHISKLLWVWVESRPVYLFWPAFFSCRHRRWGSSMPRSPLPTLDTHQTAQSPSGCFSFVTSSKPSQIVKAAENLTWELIRWSRRFHGQALLLEEHCPNC